MLPFVLFVLGLMAVFGVAGFLLALAVTYLRQPRVQPPMPVQEFGGAARISRARQPGP